MGRTVNDPQDRFSLDTIDRERAKLDAAIKAAHEAGKQPSGLAGLTNLPWLIAAVALIYWYFFH
ncbi:hypothetical protein GCM10007350_16690 [Jeongeupia chitinilytica]|uniref:Uncharacterized protein n=1 Tax=Jeongeupia chitinilytica TaxID=1041641 RepID=A0ABQ3H0T6_9NEIS|nr:hypothetical protein GCM10007350_16690 [Jeongeupia chitinilytica]